MANDDRTMPLLGHLEELRSRLIKALLAIAVALAPTYLFSSELFALLTQPLQQISPSPPMLIGTGPVEAFFTKLKVAFIAALFLASAAATNAAPGRGKRPSLSRRSRRRRAGAR